MLKVVPGDVITWPAHPTRAAALSDPKTGHLVKFSVFPAGALATVVSEVKKGLAVWTVEIMFPEGEVWETHTAGWKKLL